MTDDFRRLATPATYPARRTELQDMAQESWGKPKGPRPTAGDMTRLLSSARDSADASDYERPAKPEQPTYHLKLPMPPLANDLVRPAIIGKRNGRPVVRLVKTKEAKPWYGIVKAYAPGHIGQPLPLRGPVYLHVTWFVTRLSADIDGPLKALQDALTVVGLWHDDCQVVHLDVTKDLHAVGEKPWCEVKTGAYWHHNAEVRARLLSMKKAGGGR